MAKKQSVAAISIHLKGNVDLKIYAESEVAQDSLLQKQEEDVADNGEQPYQLLEGFFYEYQLPKDYYLQEDQDIVKSSRQDSSRGRLTPNTYVGCLSLSVMKNGELFCKTAVEVRSYKTNYRTEYRKMLENITAECADLVMIHSSPVTQRFAVDYSISAQTLYQRFAFVKSLVDSTDFRNAVQMILASPVTTWAQREESQDIRRIRRLASSQLKQIASRSGRIPIPDSHSLHDRIISIPAHLISFSKIDTIDTPENRFIKHVLREFKQFCSQVRTSLENSRNTGIDIFHEVKALEEHFDEYLSHSVFRKISFLNALPLNSPVLQRKEGYREILKVWLMFDLAAKLSWKAWDDESYSAGKRDVATLYEYWLFFKLLKIVQEVFCIAPRETKELIQQTADGLGLQLKQGRHIAVSGTYYHNGRMLNVGFHYNRTFGKADYPAGGSWTKQMRPDYTLSIWPSSFSEDEAEKQELIVHIHFDAKYKIADLKYLLSDDKENPDYENIEQKEGTFTRTDLLKMHAYKDAIRRTAGAYILYPGSKSYERRGFHEIVPGLGAFPISPSNSESGVETIKMFFIEVVEHFTDRISQREELSYHTYKVMEYKPADITLHEKLPESVYGKRIEPTNMITVLIGYYRTDQYEWIKKKGLYNIRVDSKSGLLKYGPAETGAKYILLHGPGCLITGDLWRITESAPKMMDGDELIKSGYPKDPSCKNYLVYRIEKVSDEEFIGDVWDIRRLKDYKSGHLSARPFAVTLQELMRVKV